MTDMKEMITSAIEFGAKQERERIEFMKATTLAQSESEFERAGVARVTFGQAGLDAIVARHKIRAAGGGTLAKPKTATKTRAPRQTGVMKAVKDAISISHCSIAMIVKETGAKEGTVRAALMALKKKGLASQNEHKMWSLSQDADNPFAYGNGAVEA